MESDSDTVSWQFSEHLPSLDSGISIPPPFTHDVTFTYMNHDPMFVKDSLAPILDSPESDSEVRTRARMHVHKFEGVLLTSLNNKIDAVFFSSCHQHLLQLIISIS